MGLDSSDLCDYEITPIVIAEVNLDGGSEVEETVAYTVKSPNTYDGIKIEGSEYVAIVDNQGVNIAIIDWADFLG